MIRVLRRKAKPIFWALMISFVIGTIFISWGMRQTGSQYKSKEPLYGSIDGKEITEIEYRESKGRIVERYKQRFKDFDESMIPDLDKRALDEVIKRKLLFKEAKKMGLSVTDKEVIQAMRLSFPDDATYQQARKVWNSAYWRAKENEVRDELLISKMESIVCDPIDVTNFEIREFFNDNYKQADVSHILIDPTFYVSSKRIKEQYDEFKDNYKKPGDIRVRHILVFVPPKPTKEQDTAAKNRISSIMQQLRSGADFSELAKNNSDCPSKVNGGDLGFFGPGRMDPDFEKAAYALEPGRISDIVKTRFGYHIIKCEEKKPDVPKTLKEAEEEIKKELRNEDEAIGSASKTADLVLEKIRGGTLTFEQGVSLYSNGSFSKRYQGRIGILPKLVLSGTDTKENRDLLEKLNSEVAYGRFIAPELSEVIFSLKENEVSTVTKTGFGFHIIRVNKFLSSEEKRFKEEYKEIRGYALAKKRDRILGNWYDWLKKKGKVRIAKSYTK
ncbi:MAG: peptidylprolyl isomerase [bacterium]